MAARFKTFISSQIWKILIQKFLRLVIFQFHLWYLSHNTVKIFGPSLLLDHFCSNFVTLWHFSQSGLSQLWHPSPARSSWSKNFLASAQTLATFIVSEEAEKANFLTIWPIYCVILLQSRSHGSRWVHLCCQQAGSVPCSSNYRIRL